jgi:uncharacterized membrane protein
VRDYNADEKIDWHDYYLEALTPVQTVSIRLGNMLFTPISALLHTIWFTVWLALGLDINLLTLMVSLEAIYITLFIGLGQKLQDKRAAIEAKADKKTAEHAEAHRGKLAEQQATMLKQNTEITEQIEMLTEEIHKHLGIAPKSGSA